MQLSFHLSYFWKDPPKKKGDDTLTRQNSRPRLQAQTMASLAISSMSAICRVTQGERQLVTKIAADPLFLTKNISVSVLSVGECLTKTWSMFHLSLPYVAAHVPCCFCPLRAVHQTYRKITVPLHATALLWKFRTRMMFVVWRPELWKSLTHMSPSGFWLEKASASGSTCVVRFWFSGAGKWTKTQILLEATEIRWTYHWTTSTLRHSWYPFILWQICFKPPKQFHLRLSDSMCWFSKWWEETATVTVVDSPFQTLMPSFLCWNLCIGLMTWCPLPV